MATLTADTALEVERLQIERLRQMPVWRKVALMSQMGQTVRILAQVRRHSSFNLIHLDTTFKIDVFVAKPRAFDHSQLAPGAARPESD